MTYRTWKALGGCALSNGAPARLYLGAEAHWPPLLTLGRLADVCPETERALARYAAERMPQLELAEEVGGGGGRYAGTQRI